MRFKILFATASLTISLASTVAVADTYEVVADRDTAMFGPVADDLSSGAGTALSSVDAPIRGIKSRRTPCYVH